MGLYSGGWGGGGGGGGRGGRLIYRGHINEWDFMI